MSIVPIAIYRFYAIPIKIPTEFLTHLERAILYFVWKKENKEKQTKKQKTKQTKTKTRSVKTILYIKRTSRGITILDFKLYLK